MSTPVSLIDVINRCIESNKVSLPVFNSVASRIQIEMARPEPDIKKIESIITTDQGLASQVLKIANSAFYRGLAEVATVRAAIMRLGMKEFEKIVLLAASQHTFKSNDRSVNLMMKKLWQHSVGCAYGSVWLAKRHDYGIPESQAFFAGLFHDVGKLFVLMVIEYIKRQNKTLKITDDLLIEAMARLHGREGAKLLDRWNMPACFSVVVREHHATEIDTKDYLMLLVRMANLVCHKVGIGFDKDPTILLPATLEASLLNLSEIDLAELEISLEDTTVLTS